MKQLLLCILIASFGCQIPKASSQQAAQIITTAGPSEEYKSMYDCFIDADSLSHNGYEIVKLKKKVNIAGMNDPVEVSYAVLKKDGKTLTKFDDLYHSVGNAVDFGLFPLLGTDQKQLVVSQTAPRSGRHWVVSLSHEARVIFDSFDYHLGREEFPVIDLDKDGVYEISMSLLTFWGFHTMTMAESPRPEMIFKYNEGAGKYLPANLRFRERYLAGIEDDIRKLRPKAEDGYLSNRLAILLRYIYAGEREKAWDFFNNEYNRPDRQEIETKIKQELKDEPIYKFIYR